MSIGEHATVLTAAIDRGHNDATADGHIGLVNVCQEVNVGIS